MQLRNNSLGAERREGVGSYGKLRAIEGNDHDTTATNWREQLLQGGSMGREKLTE